MLKFLLNRVRKVWGDSSAPIWLPHVEVDDRGAVAVIDTSEGGDPKRTTSGTWVDSAGKLMLKFLPNHVRKICRDSADSIRLPHVAVDDRGAVAVIDISGFTALSTRLFREHGNDGAAKLHEAINSPFEKIIGCVYARSGSIVKFAGDAAVACWSDTTANEPRRESLLLECLVCCIELLQLFDGKSGLDARSPQAGTAGGVGLHIGIGFGKINHIILGQQEPLEVGGIARREYLITGEAASEAGDMLGLGTRGQVVLSPGYYETVMRVLSGRAGSPLSTTGFLFGDPDSVGNVTVSSGDVDALQIAERLTGDLYFESVEDDSKPADEDGFFLSAVQYVESSIARYVIETEQTGTDTDDGTQRVKLTLSETRRRSSFLGSNGQDHYSDLRKVTVAFFRFPNISLDLQSRTIDAVSQPPVPSNSDASTLALGVAQYVAETAIVCIAEHGGSLRQLSFDDKGFTALAVWGLRGLAHHRTDAPNALAACLSFADRVRRAGGGSAARHAVGAVDVGVATGTVYAGLIGDERRMDGTVLGATVNLAARLMCMEATAPAEQVGDLDVWIRCDQSTFDAGKGEFEFGLTSPLVKLKGFSSPIALFPLRSAKLSRAAASDSTLQQSLFGRETEIAQLNEVVSNWKLGIPNERVLITGRSGFGKSAIVLYIQRQFLGDSTAIVCSCVAHETKRKTSFAFLSSVLRTLVSQLQSRGVTPLQLAQRGGRVSVTVPTPSRDPKRLGAPAESDACSTFLDEAVTLIEPGGLRALAAIPGFRWRNDMPAPGSDTALALSTVVAQLLLAVMTVLRFDVFLLCDDGQWIDQESLKVLQVMMQLCPSILVVISGRPREEWDCREELDSIESRCGVHIKLGPLAADSVRSIVKNALGDAEPDEQLLLDIIDRSSGIPIALNVILSTLKAQMNLGVASKGSKLTLRDFKPSESVIGNVITAQLDSLSSGFRHIVSVASVIGQYFTLKTLCEVLQALEPKSTASASDFEESDIKELLEVEDRFGFITKRAAAGDEYAFSHYLIHHGVLTAYLPQRREVVRRALIFLLIARLDKEGDDGLLLPTIIENLIQISGEDELKSRFLYRGFAKAAEARLSTDAFRYRGLLDELNPTNTAGALVSAAELLKLAGYPSQFPTNTAIAFFKAFWRNFSSFKALLASSPAKAVNVCAAFLFRSYPSAFPGASKQKDRRKVHPMENIDLISESTPVVDLLIRMDEMLTTFDMLGEHFTIAGGLDFLIIPMSALFLSHVGYHSAKDKNYWRWRVKLCYIQVGFAMLLIGMKDKSQACITAYEAYSSSAVSVREFECKALALLMLVLYRLSVKETVLFENTLLLRASLDCCSKAGRDFVPSAKATWLGFLSELIFLGKFHPKTDQDGVFHVEDIVERARKFCVDRLFVQQLESAAAVEAALLSDYLKAEGIVKKWGLSRFDRETLGLDQSQGSAQFSFVANVVCLSALLLEQNVQPEMSSREILLSIRKFAARAAPRHFLGKCCVKLISIAESILRGATERCEILLQKFLRIRDDRFPVHLHLMLQARMLRLRRLRLGKDVLAPAVEVLLERFECVDNRHDPDRLKVLFGL
ncbi:hypothetical protein DFJ73DRAFT_793715 [Zopfochytrium polystomum]|nr:hypothetical protein DFJ73DRAFT_793715 [Zopfochytrium polystomum]